MDRAGERPRVVRVARLVVIGALVAAGTAWGCQATARSMAPGAAPELADAGTADGIAVRYRALRPPGSSGRPARTGSPGPGW